MQGAVAKGAFGKIPSHGDFIRLVLPGAFIRAWDDWLQDGMIAARETLEDRWTDCYMSAPIWRFSLPGGLAGSQGVSGVLMPSVDRVGRRYPLTLALTAPQDQTALRHFCNTALFERLESIALDALDQDLDREDLARALSGLDLQTPAPLHGSGDVYSGSTVPEKLLAARQIEQMCGEVALWTSSIEKDHRMLLTRGLPDRLRFTALFDPQDALWQANALRADRA